MIIALSALTLLLAQVASPQPTVTTSPAEFKASLTGGRLHQSFYNGWTMRGSGAATWFPGAGLVDDEAPLALQAYLQRLGHLSFGVDARKFSAKDDLSLYEHRGHSADLALSGLFHIRDLVLGGHLAYSRIYDFQHPGPLDGNGRDQEHTTQLVTPELTLGLRLDELQLQASYRYRAAFDDGKQRAPEWGQLAVHVECPIEWLAFLSLSGYTIPHGGGFWSSFEIFTSPRLGLWVSGSIEKGRVYANSDRQYDWRALELGVGWWTTRSLELQFSASVSSSAVSVPGATAMITGLGNLGVVIRGPKRMRPRPEEPVAPQPSNIIQPPTGPAEKAEPSNPEERPIPNSETAPLPSVPSSPAPESPAAPETGP
jgi:hypothetical protein